MHSFNCKNSKRKFGGFRLRDNGLTIFRLWEGVSKVWTPNYTGNPLLRVIALYSNCNQLLLRENIILKI